MNYLVKYMYNIITYTPFITKMIYSFCHTKVMTSDKRYFILTIFKLKIKLAVLT